MMVDNLVQNKISGLAMHTQSLSPLFSFPQAFLKDTESDRHSQFREHGLEDGDKHKKPSSRLAEDFYQAGKAQDIGTLRSEMAVQSVASSVSHSADIQIRTQQGDVVTISINQSASSSQVAFQAEQGNSKISAYSETNSSSSAFSLSIEGDLNEDEQASLADLLNKMSKVSDKFFKGNMKSAFKHAQRVGFDTDQIAGFSMDLNSERSVQAVAAYQQTTVPEQNVNTDLLKQAGDFLAQTKDFMAETKTLLDSFAEPQQSFKDLFAGVAEISAIDQELAQDDDKPLFLSLIDNITADIFDDRDRANSFRHR